MGGRSRPHASRPISGRKVPIFQNITNRHLFSRFLFLFFFKKTSTGPASPGAAAPTPQPITARLLVRVWCGRAPRRLPASRTPPGTSHHPNRARAPVASTHAERCAAHSLFFLLFFFRWQLLTADYADCTAGRRGLYMRVRDQQPFSLTRAPDQALRWRFASPLIVTSPSLRDAAPHRLAPGTKVLYSRSLAPALPLFPGGLLCALDRSIALPCPIARGWVGLVRNRVEGEWLLW
jgi:hypothetical protein